MSEAKHTPGPWRQSGSNVRASFGGEDKSLAQVWGGIVNGASREEQVANAKLITAAPALLAACKSADLTYSALRRNITHLVRLLDKDGLPSSWLVLELEKQEKIRAAIAAAEPAGEGG